METRINIAEILRNKPSGIKLYSPIFGDCTYCYIHDETSDICVRRPYNEMSYFNFEGLYNTAGECLLFPSKEMRNWSKFAWKKGDVLVSDNGKVEVIFEKFGSDTYQSFIGKHHLDSLDENLYYQDGGVYPTASFNIETEDAAQTYINTIEERLDGKLNHETLEIEKAQPEFKDGDIVVMDTIPSMCYSKCIFILKGDLYTKDNKAHSYAFYNISNNHISFDVVDTIIRDREIRLATSLEKLQLFGMLTKEGKYWDSANKQIVDLKPKIRFKPFDKVVVFDELAKKWEYGMFSHYSKNYEGKEVITCIGGCTYFKVLPFNEETAKLIGTTNNVEN